MNHGQWIGLLPRDGVPAYDAPEEPGESLPVEQFLREAARLVRDAAEAEPQRLDASEPVDDAGVRPGATAGLLRVPAVEERERALEERRLGGTVERPGEHPLDERRDPAADVARDLGGIPLRTAELRKHPVRRGGEVRRGVEERAVQVAEDGAEPPCAHPAAASAARIAAIVALSSFVPKIAEPATNVSAPARAISAMFSTFTPPSTSRSTSRPARCFSSSIRRRAARSLSSAPGMNFCPPKPGFTDMMRTRSSDASVWSSQTSGVAGLKTRPGRQPESRISWMVRSTCSLASGWKLMMSAPALAKSGTIRSTGFTIRCTSISALVSGRIAAQTSGPTVRFGT